MFNLYLELLQSIKKQNGKWTDNLSKISTDDKVKFIIPLQDNIMISYTDGKYAKYWHNKSMDSTIR